MRWQLARRRIGQLPWVDRLPWGLWCGLCAWNAAAVVDALGTRSPHPLRFVQIGSNDGVLNDPLHDTIRTRQWTGVLVEPIPVIFDKLIANYAGVPGLLFENAAIADGDGGATIYTVEHHPDDPGWADQLSSFDRDVVLSHRDALRDLDTRVHEVHIEAITLPGLIARHGLRQVDVLHVDSEGYDGEVIRQIDFSAPWAPDFIIFEKKHLDTGTYRHTIAQLKHAGYRCVNIWPDELAYRVPPGSARHRAHGSTHTASAGLAGSS